jgi:VanZ family protein
MDQSLANEMKHTIRYWLTSAITLLILIAVLLPGSKVPDVKLVGFDKIVHIIMFFAWAVAVRYDFSDARMAGVITVGFLFSLFTEILQIFVEDRSFDWYDTLADITGLVAGCLMAKPVAQWIGRFIFQQKQP